MQTAQNIVPDHIYIQNFLKRANHDALDLPIIEMALGQDNEALTESIFFEKKDFIENENGSSF